MNSRSGSAQRRIAVSANSSWALTNYRMNLLKALQDRGYSLAALVPPDQGVGKLEAAGIEVHTVPIRAHGTSPLQELALLARYTLILRRLRPSVFLGFTIKPNIYGSLAGAACGIPVINNVTGLGVVFTTKGPLRWFVGHLYRLAFKRSKRVFFQNRENLELFKSLGFVGDGQAALLPGSGIDLNRFVPSSNDGEGGANFRFLLPSRMLWQKGIAEYCDAARRIRADRPRVSFQLLGGIGETSKGAVPKKQIDEWHQQGLIDYLGETDDIRPYFEAADCIVLPSYYPEGVPRALIEAAAMGKPIITTDTPGCRDAVVPDETGFLCEPRSSISLAKAMGRMVDLSDQERQFMAKQARKLAEQRFDDRLIIDAYLGAIEEIAIEGGDFR
jgi:glycosyltransferase involved in cell wall biosynthesis